MFNKGSFIKTTNILITKKRKANCTNVNNLFLVYKNLKLHLWIHLHRWPPNTEFWTFSYNFIKLWYEQPGVTNKCVTRWTVGAVRWRKNERVGHRSGALALPPRFWYSLGLPFPLDATGAWTGSPGKPIKLLHSSNMRKEFKIKSHPHWRGNIFLIEILNNLTKC